MATGRATRDQEARREVTCLAPKRRRGDGAAERSIVVFVVVVEKNMATNVRTRYLSWRCTAVDDLLSLGLRQMNERRRRRSSRETPVPSSYLGRIVVHGDQV
jgi:hypothetical protein